jgi:hypothetical protein
MIVRHYTMPKDSVRRVNSNHVCKMETQRSGFAPDIDLSDTLPPKYDLDSRRTDDFGLHVDTRKQTPVPLREECKSHARDE